MARQDTHLTQTGEEVQEILNAVADKADKATSQAYGFGTTFPANPKDGDVFVIAAHEDQLTLTLPEGETSIQLDVPYGKLRWEVDEACQLARIAAIKWLNVLTNMDEYEYIPGGHVGEQPLYYDDTIERGRDFSFRWVDGECVSYEDFVANFQYISLYSIVPDVAYEYKNGVWEERKDMSDVLRYSYQDLNDWEKSQARENISAFKDIVDISDTITSNLSLARYITMLVAERGPGIYTFRFTGKLSDGDTDTATYRVLLVGASEADCIVSINSATLISRIDSKLYRILLNNGLYYLEPLYIKPATGIPASDLADGVIPDVSGKADAATTLVGYGITDAYTKTEVDSKVASTYKPAGSVADVAGLGSLTAANLGKVYNFTASFTTTSDFVEGSGKTYPVGTNVVIVDVGTAQNPSYKYDVLAGFVDLSGYYQLPSGGIPSTDLASAVQTSLGKADTALQSFTETDPTVPSWAKASSKPSYDYSEINNTPTIPDELADLSDDSTHRVVTDAEKSTWNGKQDAIVFNTAYNASSNKAATMSDVPTVPTISTDIASDGTSDTKTASPKAVKTYADTKYIKPSGGIPKTDLDSGVKASLELADSAIQPAEFNELEEEVGTIGNGAYEEAWDGSSAPVVADIPAGVSVTYSSTSYTGTLAASASTVDKIYLVSDGNGNYDRYVTVESGGTYSWKKVGTTAIPLSNYATKSEVNQLGQEVGEAEHLARVSENGFFVVDSEMNIGLKVDESGAHARNLLEYEIVEI